jgi:16S rRNA G966 N2-methylase RsmD
VSTALVVPAAEGLVKPDEIYAFERAVRERVRDMDLEELAPNLAKIEELAKALAKTKLSPPAMAAARRVEWQIGRLLGPNPGQGKRLSVGSDSEVLSENERYEFRLLASLDGSLDWDDIDAWAKSRARLVKLAKERGRKPRSKTLDVRRGDFREALADVEPGSVSLVLTDPPYAEDALPLYGDLAAFAAEKLCDGGSLVCFTGQGTMPAAHAELSKHLRYWWTLALEHRGGGQQLPGKWVRIKWKPILWFVKDGRRDKTYVHDLIRGVKPDKELHEWAQGVDEVVPLIESLTAPDELVVDPFAGSGSFGLAASKLGRRFIGAEVGS